MNQKLVFVHIPKTAGTAFRLALKAMVGRKAMFWIGPNTHPKHEWDSISPQDIASRLVIGGHKTYHQFREKVGQDRSVFVTLLRDPIRRAVSFYQFVKSRPAQNPLAAKLKGHDLRSAIDVPVFRELIRNAQCRAIAGVPSFAAAVEEIQNADWMIDVDANIDHLIQRVSERFGWPCVKAERHNVSRPSYFEELCTAEIADAIRMLNQEDIQLFEKFNTAPKVDQIALAANPVASLPNDRGQASPTVLRTSPKQTAAPAASDRALRKFAILGERCSGTNFLQNSIKANFKVEEIRKYGSKHFFGTQDYQGSDDTLFVAIVRNPMDWIGSFFLRPHHLAMELRQNWEAFLKNEFWSFYPKQRGELFGAEIIDDRNWITKQRFRDIFENREIKCRFLLEEMEKRVKHYVLIRYEDLCEDYERTMIRIQAAGKLERIDTENWISVKTYKGKNEEYFVAKEYDIPIEYRQYIVDHLSDEIECRLGYRKNGFTMETAEFGQA